jgi:hypothetical protein
MLLPMRRTFPVAVLVLVLSWPALAQAQGSGPAGPSDQIVLSGDVLVPRGAQAGEIVVFHGSATVLGVGTGDVVVLDGPVVIAGRVHGDVVALDGDVELRASAQVAGGVIAGGRVVRADGSVVGGTVRGDVRVSLAWAVGELGGLVAPIALAVSTLLAGFLLLLLAPRGAERVSQAAGTAPFASASWGIVLAVLVPVIAAAATASVLGLPLGLSLLLGLGLFWLVGLGWATWIVGRLVVREPRSRVGALLTGWAIAAAVGLVPYLDVVWWSLGAVFGLGAMTVAAWRVRGAGRHRVGAGAVEATAPGGES